MRSNLSVVIPVFNECQTVKSLVSSVLAVDVVGQVIVVDDGSEDGSAGALEPLSANRNLLIRRHRRNQGKGAAVRTGLQFVTHSYTLIQDADWEYDPKDISSLARRMNSPNIDVVYGSRFARGGHFSGRVVLDLGVSVLNRFIYALYRLRLTDCATCYKLFRTEDLCRMKLESERFELCSELTAKAARLGLRLEEVPIRYVPRTRQQGKKLRLTDGIGAVRGLLRYRGWKPDDHPWVGERCSHSSTPTQSGRSGVNAVRNLGN